jgi:hypothetical protein
MALALACIHTTQSTNDDEDGGNAARNILPWLFVISPEFVTMGFSSDRGGWF